MPLAAQSRKARDISRPPTTGAPEFGKMRHLKNERHILQAIGKIFGGNDPTLALFLRGGYCLPYKQIAIGSCCTMSPLGGAAYGPVQKFPKIPLCHVQIWGRTSV